jgi:signal transduction histidine kinase
MQQNCTLSTQQQEYLRIINRSGKSLLNLINDVLEISKIDAGQTILNSDALDLHSLLQTLWSTFQPQAEIKHLSLQFDLPPDLPQHIIGDESKLHQVLSNLLSNAIKFTENGRVILKVFFTPSPHASCTSREPGAAPAPFPLSLFFQVEDTGCGIASEEIDKLFGPFVQTTNGYKAGNGTGLGLAISHEFVQLMGGNLEVKSTLEEGSIFYFHIVVNLLESAQIYNSIIQTPALNLSEDLQQDLTKQHLQIMPKEWITSLHQAAIEVDADRVFQLISQIPKQFKLLTKQLTILTRNYDFDAIIALSRGDENV